MPSKNHSAHDLVVPPPVTLTPAQRREFLEVYRKIVEHIGAVRRRRLGSLFNEEDFLAGANIAYYVFGLDHLPTAWTLGPLLGVPLFPEAGGRCQRPALNP